MATQQVNYNINVTGNLEAKLNKATKGFDKLEKEVDQVKGKIGKASGKGGSGLAGSFAGLGGVIAGVFAVDQIVQFGKEVFAITAEFQKFEAVLTNTLGSKSEAQKSLKLIQDFAADTPFSVTELSDSFVKLANRGFVPVAEEMRQLGDLASSVGKPFDQLTEAILDAQTGEFERLKEFGIKASKEGDKVTFSFKGQTTTVKNSEEAIRDYVLALGDAEGVSGAMAAISGTLEGQVSNLGDNFDGLKLAIGNALAGDTTNVIGSLNSIVTYLRNNVGGLIKDIKDSFSPLSEFVSLFSELAGTLGVNTEEVNGLTIAFKALFGPIKQALELIFTLPNMIMKALLSMDTFMQAWTYLPIVVDAAWGAFKDFYKGLIDLTLNTGKSIFNILKEAFDVKNILSGDKSGINVAIQDAVNQLNTDLNALDIKANFQTRLEEGLRQKELDKILPTGKGVPGSTALNASTAGAIGTTDTELTKIDDEVTGTKATNINLNIEKLIENLNFNTTNLAETSTKIKEEVTKVLIEALRDTTAIATN